MARDGLKLVGTGSRSKPRPSPSGMFAGPSVLSVPSGSSGSTGTSLSPASPFTWSDIEWIRGRWTGPLVVKGVLTGEDAVRAVSCGSDGVIVSNHGGRQLDGAPATLRVLPEVVAAVGDDAAVLVDGGVRRGSDVIKALALGARAVLIGRPYLYGLGAAGERGVDRILEIFEEEMSRTMSLLGCTDVGSLDASWLQPTAGRRLLEEDRDALSAGDPADGLAE